MEISQNCCGLRLFLPNLPSLILFTGVVLHRGVRLFLPNLPSLFLFTGGVLHHGLRLFLPNLPSLFLFTGVVLHRGLRLFLPASAPSLSTHHRPTHDLASASRKNKQDGDVHWQGGLRIALHVATLHWVSHFSTSGTQ